MYKDTVPNDVHNHSIQSSSSDVNNDIVNDMMKASDMKKIDEFNNNGGMYNGKQ